MNMIDHDAPWLLKPSCLILSEGICIKKHREADRIGKRIILACRHEIREIQRTKVHLHPGAYSKIFPIPFILGFIKIACS
jgi:hypothetical protein